MILLHFSTRLILMVMVFFRFMHSMEDGATLGRACEATVVDTEPQSELDIGESPVIKSVLRTLRESRSC